jgi:very-short-patch-repair endonuclease
MSRIRFRKNSPEVLEAAREMRGEATAAEDVLWKALRNRALGFKFRRQHPAGRFILDFWCADRRLAIELDGPIHDLQTERDAERTAVLEAHGYRVIRFRNEEVLHDLPGVLLRIKTALDEPPSPPRHPLSRSLGEGAGG